MAKSSATSRPSCARRAPRSRSKSSQRAELGVHGVVAALGAADRPRAAGVAGLGGQRVVAALAVRAPDRMDRRQVHDVEAHGRRALELRLGVLEGRRAGPASSPERGKNSYQAAKRARSRSTTHGILASRRAWPSRGRGGASISAARSGVARGRRRRPRVSLLVRVSRTGGAPRRRARAPPPRPTSAAPSSSSLVTSCFGVDAASRGRRARTGTASASASIVNTQRAIRSRTIVAGPAVVVHEPHRRLAPRRVASSWR